MKTRILSLVVFSMVFAFGVHAQFNHENLKIKASADSDPTNGPAAYDNSFRHNNLKLYPIIANATFVHENRDLGQFTLLKEAIEQQKIVVSETGANQELNNNVNQSNNRGDVSGTVNTLVAKNVSTDTIFIMAGDVVKGGKQDRVIGQDIVILPGQQINLNAFCVEHNRWTTTDGNGGQFNGYFSMSSMDIRKIVTEEKNQQNVWNKVDEHTSKNNAESTTHTYTNLTSSEEYQTQLKGYLDKLGKAFQNDSSVIGVIAVTGDKVIGCDLFATHQLFDNAYENLIHSYIGYAITNGSEVTITDQQVFAYLDQILKSEEGQKEAVEQDGTVYEYRKKKLHMTKY